MLEQITFVCGAVDGFLTRWLDCTEFTRQLMITPTLKFITELLIVLLFLVVNYEILYWSGIHLGLWEYHAKHIFTEIPVHCAHVYVRLNVARAKDGVTEYYTLKRRLKGVIPMPLISNWSELNDLGKKVFDRDQFVKYHLEFSPEDFDSSKQPEYGCTVDHLRKRVVTLWRELDLYGPENKREPVEVVVYNNKDEEVTEGERYLSQTGIETGNVIDVVIVI